MTLLLVPVLLAATTIAVHAQGAEPVASSSTAPSSETSTAHQSAAATDAAAAIPEHFRILAPMLGRTWRGIFSESTPEKPIVDVARWELVLGGKAVRVLHSINDGTYGGETMIVWDEAKKSLVYYYFTTAGFMTTGTMRSEAGAIVTHEVVSGGSNVTDVVGTYTPQPDGTIKTEATYLSNGESVGGRVVVYVEAPEAAVVLP